MVQVGAVIPFCAKMPQVAATELQPEWKYDMRTKLLAVLVVFALAFRAVSSARAITCGRPDTNNEYPNVASVRGYINATNTARISCSGSLRDKDTQKFVILTAAHCTDAWTSAIAAGTINSVGVSFDQIGR